MAAPPLHWCRCGRSVTQKPNAELRCCIVSDVPEPTEEEMEAAGREMEDYLANDPDWLAYQERKRTGNLTDEDREHLATVERIRKRTDELFRRIKAGEWNIEKSSPE